MVLFLIAAAVVLALGVVLFNALVRNRMLVREAWSGIEVQLKRRHDLIPNLVEVVKGYAQFERSTLERIVQLRSQAAGVAGVVDKAALENNITQALKSVVALAEAYPDLKANQQFLSLQSNLVTVEDEIQLARRYYNGTVRDNNIAVERFPGNIVAGMFGFPRAEFFEIETATERAVPEVKV